MAAAAVFGYPNQLEPFLAVIARQAEPVVSPRDGMMTLTATLAADLAARVGRTVTRDSFGTREVERYLNAPVQPGPRAA